MKNNLQTKIILASSSALFTSAKINDYLNKIITEYKIAYITTASNEVPDTKYIKRRMKMMDRLNYKYQPVDIAKYNLDELENILIKYDLIFVEGGNTFYLLKMIRRSGFDKIIKKLLNKGIVYVGLSAGSYVATPSIITATWSKRGFDRCDVKNYQAMNLVPFLVKAHFNASKDCHYIKKAKKLSKPVRFLNDDQAIIVSKGEYILIGDGEGIVVNNEK